jgi:hypothetical protein
MASKKAAPDMVGDQQDMFEVREIMDAKQL